MGSFSPPPPPRMPAGWTQQPGTWYFVPAGSSRHSTALSSTSAVSVARGPHTITGPPRTTFLFSLRRALPSNSSNWHCRPRRPSCPPASFAQVPSLEGCKAGGVLLACSQVSRLAFSAWPFPLCVVAGEDVTPAPSPPPPTRFSAKSEPDFSLLSALPPDDCNSLCTPPGASRKGLFHPELTHTKVFPLPLARLETLCWPRAKAILLLRHLLERTLPGPAAH